jgi:hypothetical protein
MSDLSKSNKPKHWRSWSKLFHRVIGAAIVAGSLGGFAVSAQAFTKSEIMRMVIEEAEATSVPAALALAVARNESNFDANALSPKGARGVMQIMPRTGRDVYGVNEDELWDPRLNIQLGIDFLEDLIERYDGHWDLALSYYNGGSAVGNLPNARVLPATRQYVNAVLESYDLYQAQAAVWQGIGQSIQPWTPARTDVADLGPVNETDTTGFRVRWRLAPNVPQSDRRGPLLQGRPGGLDDFDAGMDDRLAGVRGTLDDFTPRRRIGG